jgi:cyclopropane-fatty-acyl-phospholipid synthase
MPDAAATTVALVEDVMGPTRAFDVRLWDGQVLAGSEPRFTLVLTHPGALRAFLWPPTQLNMAEAYVRGDIDIEGDLYSVFELADALLVDRRWGVRERLALARRLFSLPNKRRPAAGREPAQLRGRRFTQPRDREAVTYHYDTSNEFFATYLDERMVYTCAYFESRNDDLDTAQEQKLDLVCRKLRLREGERLLDIGCGWGALLMHAAERYGVEALGITLSAPQAELANERIRAAGLADRCRVEVRDYRDLDAPAAFDKVASICMFEAVGEEHLPEFFERTAAFLRPGGVFLNQGVARNYHFERTARRGPSFMERYVFPDGGVVPISSALRAAEVGGLEVRDVESLREHYELTLRHWVSRLEEHRDDAIRATNEQTYRVWRLYMSGSSYGMKTGRLNVYQALFAKPDRGASGLPLTRDDWYVREDAPQPAFEQVAAVAPHAR